MTPLRLIAAALGHARRRLAVSMIVVLIAGLASGGVVYLIGDSTQRSNTLLADLNSPNVRSVTIRATSDTEQGRLPDRTVQWISQLSGVDRAVGLSNVQSVSIAGIDDSTVSVGYFTVTTLTGDPPYELTAGRPPSSSEAIASKPAAQRLRLDVPTASQIQLDDNLIPVVGTYQTSELGAISDLLDQSLLTPTPTAPTGYALLVMVARQPADVTAVVDAATRLLTEFGTDRYTVEFDARAAEVETLVASAGRSNVRSTAIGIVAITAVIDAAIAFVTAALQRREIARRRALGFTRTAVFATLVIEGGILSGIGAALGSATAALILSADPAGFDNGQPIAAAGLIALIGIVATIPGGALAAYQDPARILRVP